MHVLSVDGSFNARSLGSPARPWLVRSAALDTLSRDGERTLRDLGVDRVLDLREPNEQHDRAHGLAVQAIPLYGEAPPSHGSLEQVYAGLLRDRGEQLVAAVVAIAEHPGTYVVHCTAGKDRTGLVVALARIAGGDTREEVIADYASSGSTVRPARVAVAAAQLDGLGLSPAARASAERLHLDSPAEALEAALDLVDELGGVRRYLLDRGAQPAHLHRLAARAAAGRASRA